MATSEQVYVVCTDCGGQSLISVSHKCEDGGQRAGMRLAAEMLDDAIATFTYAPWAVYATGSGLLWLYRIAYRVRSRMNGLEKYKDRAELARVVCGLGGELYK